MLQSIVFAIVGVIGLAMPVAADDVRAAIEQTNAHIVEAFKAGDAAAIAGFYSEDAKMLPPDATEVAGREAIQQFWQSWLDDGLKNLTLEAIEVEADGDLAYEIGNFSLQARPRTIPWRPQPATIWWSGSAPPGAIGNCTSIPGTTPRRSKPRGSPAARSAPLQADHRVRPADAGSVRAGGATAGGQARALIPCQTGRKS